MSELFIPTKLEEYDELWDWINSLKLKSMSSWEDAIRLYAKKDLYFLVNYVLSHGTEIHSYYKTPLFRHQHYVDFARQIEYQRDNCFLSVCTDARSTGKSTWRTKALSIQYALNVPDISIFIFSKTKQLATKHLKSIKDEVESNALLKRLFPDVFWEDPVSAVKNMETQWSVEDGLRVKRKLIKTSQTFERHALFEGGPVGTRPDIIMFDDIEDGWVVGTADRISQLDDSYHQAISLVTPVAIDEPRLFVTNTRFAETGLIQRLYDKARSTDILSVSAYPGENLEIAGSGPLQGTAQYPLTTELLWMKYTASEAKQEYALQFALDYKAAADARLREENLVFYEEPPEKMAHGKNIYITVDASKGVHDPTAICAIGVGADHRYYWVGAHIEKLDPSKPEFCNAVYLQTMKWANLCAPGRLIEVRVEQFGNQVWADMIRENFTKRGCYIPVVDCKATAKKTKDFETGKNQRIFQRWGPMVNNGLFCLPKAASRGGWGLMMDDKDGNTKDVIPYFLDTEFRSFPRAKHDDILDSIGLIHDEKVNEDSPIIFPSGKPPERYYIKTGNRKTSWMSA